MSHRSSLPVSFISSFAGRQVFPSITVPNHLQTTERPPAPY